MRKDECDAACERSFNSAVFRMVDAGEEVLSPFVSATDPLVNISVSFLLTTALYKLSPCDKELVN